MMNVSLSTLPETNSVPITVLDDFELVSVPIADWGNKLTFPTFGKPTMPVFKAIQIPEDLWIKDL